MKLRNILALCCTIILSLISCSKDKGLIKDTLSGSEWTWSNNRTGLSPKYKYANSTKLKFTSETEGVLSDYYIENGGHMSEKEARFDFTYELKGSSITLTFPESDEEEIKVLQHITAIGTLDREKGTIEFRYTKDGKEVSDVFHRSK